MYISPIFALRFNVLSAFEKANPQFRQRLQSAVDEGRISPEILLDESLGPPKGPFVKREEGAAAPVIHLHIVHLEVLWAFIYGWMVLYEEGVQKPLTRGQSPTEITEKEPLLWRAHALFEWAQSLRQSYAPWPNDLPSPTSYQSEGERWYGEKANLVFQEATSFLLIHEFVHAERQHLDIRAENPASEVILDLEKDADNGALEALATASDSDTDKLSKGWAISAAILSSYLLRRDPPAVSVGSHLPLHHRLEHMLRGLDFKGERERSYFQYLSSIVLRHLLQDQLDAQSPSVFDTAADAMTDKMDRLDGFGSLAE